jgi:phytoene/squalene synthetase
MIQFDPSQFKSEIYAHLKQRGGKYDGMIKGLKAFRFYTRLTFQQTRGDLLESYYVLMRYIDDIVDGDAPLPEGYATPLEYVEAKIRFSETRNRPNDEADYLMLYCFDLAHKLHIEIDKETTSILNSMRFDALRRFYPQKVPDAEEYGKMIICSEKVLHEHFHLLDIEGTVNGAIKVFGRDPDQLYSAIEPLGEASRIFYNLKDYWEDIKAGLVNISREDITAYRISEEDIVLMREQSMRDDLEHKVLASGAERWFHDQARIGLNKIEESRRLRRNERIGLVVSYTLRRVYERPAEEFFEGALASYAT